MERQLFKDSAFKHGYERKDFEAVMRNARLFLRSRHGYRNVYEILGRNDAGDYLHVITRRYRHGRERIVIVFHMNRMVETDRRRFVKLIEQR